MYGERLRKARKANKKTLVQVGRIMNMSHSAISRFENENRKIEPETLAQFCRLYKVSADYILGLPQDMPYPKD